LVLLDIPQHNSTIIVYCSKRNVIPLRQRPMYPDAFCPDLVSTP